jgi:hypothetical protein
MRSMGIERSMSDRCLYYKWMESNGLVIIVSWIDVLKAKRNSKLESFVTTKFLAASGN